MVETYNLTLNRNNDSQTIQFPYFNLNLTLTGEKSEPAPPGPVQQYPLPFTKKVLGESLVDFDENPPNDAIMDQYANQIYVDSNGNLHMYNGTRYSTYQPGNGFGNEIVSFKGLGFGIQAPSDTLFQRFLNLPETDIQFTTGRDNLNGWSEINLQDMVWTTTRPSSANYIGYDKTTDTLYGSSVAPNRQCEYYTEHNLDRMWGLQNFPMLIDCWNATITGASKVIPSLLQIN